MNEKACRQLGESILGEILLRAGLAQTGPDAVGVSLDFSVEAEEDTKTVVIRCERVSGPPIELRLGVDS